MTDTPHAEALSAEENAQGWYLYPKDPVNCYLCGCNVEDGKVHLCEDDDGDVVCIQGRNKLRRIKVLTPALQNEIDTLRATIAAREAEIERQSAVIDELVDEVKTAQKFGEDILANFTAILAAAREAEKALASAHNALNAAMQLPTAEQLGHQRTANRLADQIDSFRILVRDTLALLRAQLPEPQGDA